MLCEAEGITAVAMTVTEMAEHQKRRGLWPMFNGSWPVAHKSARRSGQGCVEKSRAEHRREGRLWAHSTTDVSRCSILCMIS